MGVFVIHFIILDGIVSDPDGSDGTPAGGWAFRHGPGSVGGDKFRLGSVLDDSRIIEGDVAGAVKREQGDVIITGSLSVVHADGPGPDR